MAETIGHLNLYKDRSIVGFNAAADTSGRAENAIDFLEMQLGYKVVPAEEIPSDSVSTLHFQLEPPLIDEDDFNKLYWHCWDTWHDGRPGALCTPNDFSELARRAGGLGLAKLSELSRD